MTSISLLLRASRKYVFEKFEPLDAFPGSKSDPPLFENVGSGSGPQKCKDLTRV